MHYSHSDIKQPYYCSNCRFPLEKKAKYCHNCGQKAFGGELTLKELFSQFFDSFFNLDSKIFQTLGAVFIPGKLTEAFLDGQRRKYYHPIRLFLVLILIALAALSYRNESDFLDAKQTDIERLKERRRLIDVFDSNLNSVKSEVNDVQINDVFDTLSYRFHNRAGERVDSFNINKTIQITDDFDFYIGLDDFEKYTPEQLIDVYGVKGFYNRLLVQQKVKMIMEGTNFIPFVMGKVTWAVFFVLLILALIFKLLYFTKGFLYLEHLVFGIHLHSFYFILAAGTILLEEETREEFMGWAIIIMAIYLFISMKRVYKESYLITFLKFIFIVLVYFILFIAGLALTIIGSFLIF